MIGKLKGNVDGVFLDSFILDVQGVGYLIYTPLSTLEEIRLKTSLLSFYIETVVKEDSITLYGFTTLLEQTWFRLLRTVQGVGARVALTLLSRFSPELLYGIILNEDKQALTTAEGVGTKLALRLITELKDRLAKDPLLQGDFVPSSSSSFKENPHEGLTPLEKDSLSALENLGYRRSSILKSLSNLRQLPTPPQTLSDMIRFSLKDLSQTSYNERI